MIILLPDNPDWSPLTNTDAFASNGVLAFAGPEKRNFFSSDY